MDHSLLNLNTLQSANVLIREIKETINNNGLYAVLNFMGLYFEIVQRNNEIYVMLDVAENELFELKLNSISQLNLRVLFQIIDEFLTFSSL